MGLGGGLAGPCRCNLPAPRHTNQSKHQIDEASIGSVPQTVNDQARTEELDGTGAAARPSGGEQTEEPLRTQNSAPQGFGCLIPGCGKSFRTANGLGQHEARSHPEERAKRLEASQPTASGRSDWTNAERESLIMERLRLEREFPKMLAKELDTSTALYSKQHGKGRTTEGVRCQRTRSKEWKKIDERLRAEQALKLNAATHSKLGNIDHSPPLDDQGERVTDDSAAGSAPAPIDDSVSSHNSNDFRAVGPEGSPTPMAPALAKWQCELRQTFMGDHGPRQSVVATIIKSLQNGGKQPSPSQIGAAKDVVRTSFDAWVATLRHGEADPKQGGGSAMEPGMRPSPAHRGGGVTAEHRPEGRKKASKLNEASINSNPSSERPKRVKVKRGKRSTRRAALRRQHKGRFDDAPYKAAKEVIDGLGPFQATENREAQSTVPLSELEAYWKGVFSEVGTSTDSSGRDLSSRAALRELLDGAPRHEVQYSLLRPVDAEELKRGLKSANFNSAPGPDKLTVKRLSKLDIRQDLLDWMNLFLLIEQPPEALLQGVVTLVPKVPKPEKPNDFRPITVASALLRIFHSILARRWDDQLPIPIEQRGFRRNVDGCFDNTYMLKHLLKSHKRNCRSLYLLFCDIRNAFGAVQHEAVFEATSRMGVPPPMVNYLRNVYRGFKVRIKGGTAAPFSVVKGVLQGDPLSSVAFNCVMSLVMSTQRHEYGVGRIDGNHRGDGRPSKGAASARITSYASYADDTILFGETREEIRMNFEALKVALRATGMELNAKKCQTFELAKSTKDKVTFNRVVPFLKVGDDDVPPLGEASFYRYLGLKFSPEGCAGYVTLQTVERDLARISAARIDPQDRVFCTVKVLIPRMHHSLVLGGATGKALRELDRLVRKFIRRWLHLPHDTPIGYFHASVGDGGLGIPALSTTIPRLRADRTKRLQLSKIPLVRWLLSDPAIATATLKDSSVETIRVRTHRINIGTKEEARDSWRKSLVEERFDGRGLAIARLAHQSSKWLTQRNCGITPKEYVKAVAVRCNLLKTPARSGRGGRGNIYCPQCRTQIAGLGHILQRCPLSHGYRVDRHDSVARLIIASIRNRLKGAIIVEEPVISKEGTELKRREADSMVPDIVIYHNGDLTIIDPTVISDHSTWGDLGSVGKSKSEKYDNEAMRRWARERFAKGKELKSFQALGLPITWRGLWRPRDLNAIILRLSLNKNLQVLLAIRTLVFGWRIWNSFCQQRT